jgi:glycosyltransferase involved in cell wall biosynthesis
MINNYKILIVTNRAPYPLKDGGALAMHAIIQGYIDAGWEVGLLSMNTSRHPAPIEKVKIAFKGVSWLKLVPVDNEISIRKITRNFIFSTEPEHVALFYNIEFEAEFNEALTEFNPDVVQFESVFLSSYLGALKKLPQILKILRVHNIEHNIWHRLAKETSNPLKKAYLNNLANRIERYEVEKWSYYDMLLPITQNDANLLTELLPKATIITAPFGIKTDSHTPITNQISWDAYHIGAMDWLPNQEALRWFIKEVWPIVRTEVPEFKFHYAGRNMPDEFFNYATMGIFCHGEVEDADQFIYDKGILIVPLKSGSGVRVKTMEAMAAGKLVISTKVGMEGIEVEKGKHYLEANSAEAFIEQIKWIFNNKPAALEIAKAGQELVLHKYNNDQIVQEVTLQIKEFIRSRKA